MKWVHEFLGKFIFRSSKAYIFGPKGLFLSFPEGKDNFPSFHMLNISNCRKLDFSVKEGNENGEKLFILVANVYEPGEDTPQVLSLGKFETRSEVTGALLQLKSKLYNPGFSLIKTLSFIVLFLFLVGIIFDSGKSWLSNKDPSKQMAQQMSQQLQQMPYGQSQYASGNLPIFPSNPSATSNAVSQDALIVAQQASQRAALLSVQKATQQAAQQPEQQTERQADASPSLVFKEGSLMNDALKQGLSK